MMRSRILPLGGPLLVVVALWGLVVVVSGSTAAADRRIAEDRDRVAILYEEIAAAEQLENEDVGGSEAIIAAVETAVPDSPDIASLLVTIHGLAADNRVTVEQVIPSIVDAGLARETSAGAGTKSSTIAVAMSGSGTYEGTMAFLEALESSSRLVLVSQIELAAIGESDSLVFDVVLEVYTTASLTGDEELDEFVDIELEGEDLEVDE